MQDQEMMGDQSGLEVLGDAAMRIQGEMTRNQQEITDNRATIEAHARRDKQAEKFKQQAMTRRRRLRNRRDYDVMMETDPWRIEDLSHAMEANAFHHKKLMEFLLEKKLIQPCLWVEDTGRLRLRAEHEVPGRHYFPAYASFCRNYHDILSKGQADIAGWRMSLAERKIVGVVHHCWEELSTLLDTHDNRISPPTKDILEKALNKATVEFLYRHFHARFVYINLQKNKGIEPLSKGQAQALLLYLYGLPMNMLKCKLEPKLLRVMMAIEEGEILNNPDVSKAFAHVSLGQRITAGTWGKRFDSEQWISRPVEALVCWRMGLQPIDVSQEKFQASALALPEYPAKDTLHGLVHFSPRTQISE